jgi:predicted dehydrogenase
MGDKPIGIGLVGAGWMGNEHSQAYRRIPEVWPEAGLTPVLTHIADTVPSIAESNARRWGYTRWSSDWRSVIEDPDVDIVDITGPNAIHCEVALAAAAAGKHVACEKPLGRSAAEAAAMAEATHTAGVLSNCNFEYRHNPAVQHARNLATSGKLGQITHARGLYLCDYGRSPKGPFSWRFDREVAGWGALGDIGSHSVDMLEMVLGQVSEVVAVGATFVPFRVAAHFTDDQRLSGGTLFARANATDRELTAVTNEDYTSALLRFDSGAIGTLEVSRASAGPKDSLRMAAHGSSGAFEWDSERMNEIQVYLSPED